jgi:basic membrane lipoprotein Med (substrate-binding protein (PBP1-ABC) superfamily)
MSKHPGGRPPLYDDPKKLQKKIEEYFNEHDGKEQKATVSGLAYYLGFESRQSMYDYCKHAKFSYIIKRARLKLESYYEEKVQGTCPTGPIFVLKNMGWKDEHTVNTKNKNYNIDFTNLSEEEAEALFKQHKADLMNLEGDEE